MHRNDPADRVRRIMKNAQNTFTFDFNKVLGVSAYFALQTIHCTIAGSGPEPLYGEWGRR